ncbi:MAG: hypothetical protein VYE59_01410, partial [Candidatus Thermoplasmatota archaeon]|nr:hypothetical protein [Candidatus Thermoplasmatota archaeon]
MTFNDFESYNSSNAAIAHSKGITKMDISGNSEYVSLPISEDGTSEVHSIELLGEDKLLATRITNDSTIIELLYEGNNWEKIVLDRNDWDNELFRIEVISDEKDVLIRAHDLFGSKTCRLSIQELMNLNQSMIECEWGDIFIGQNKLVEIGGVMWDVTSTNSEQMKLMSEMSFNESDEL